MPNAVIEDRDKFKAFLAAQPLLQWSAQRQQEIARGMGARGQSPVHPPPKNDNADLAAALAMMA